MEDSIIVHLLLRTSTRLRSLTAVGIKVVSVFLSETKVIVTTSVLWATDDWVVPDDGKAKERE